MRKALSSTLFLYSVGFVFFLTFSGMKKLLTEGGVSLILPGLLFLPIPLYFTWKLIKTYLIWRYTKPAANEQSKGMSFRIGAFLGQEDAYFQVTLGLLSLAISGTILRGLLAAYPEAITNNEWFILDAKDSGVSDTDQSVSEDKLVYKNGGEIGLDTGLKEGDK
jgi:hypothetical protein